MKSYILFTVFVFFFGNSLYSQDVEAVRWKFETNKLNENTYELKIIAQINGGWILYAKGNNPAAGRPLKFTFLESNSFEKIGKMVCEPKVAREFDDILLSDLVYHKGIVEFKQIVQLKRMEDIVIKISGQAARTDKSISKIIDYEHSFTFKKNNNE